MEMERNNCPTIEVDGFVERGKEFDIEIRLPEDRRNSVFGVIKDLFDEPIEDAVVQLAEIDPHDRDERRPVSHTFTNENGEFIFGPLCPDRSYELLVWKNKVRHVKICKETKHERKCLKGKKLKCPKEETSLELPC